MTMVIGGFSGLQAAVAGARYKPGWSFRLEEGRTGAGTCTDQAGGPPVTTSTAVPPLTWPLFAVIILRTPDSGHPDRMITVCHRFEVPPMPDFPGLWWQEWLLRRIVDVETHEACENFRVNGERPFYPAHGPGADLYAIRAVARG